MTKNKQVNHLTYTCRYKVTVTAGDVKYGQVTKSEMRPTVVYSQWMHNGQPSNSQQVTVKRTTERKKTALWKTRAGFSSSFSLSASAQLPLIGGFEARGQVGLDLKLGLGEEISETETFSVDEVVTVPPMKSVKIDWIITDVVQVRRVMVLRVSTNLELSANFKASGKVRETKHWGNKIYNI